MIRVGCASQWGDVAQSTCPPRWPPPQPPAPSRRPPAAATPAPGAPPGLCSAPPAAVGRAADGHERRFRCSRCRQLDGRACGKHLRITAMELPRVRASLLKARNRLSSILSKATSRAPSSAYVSVTTYQCLLRSTEPCARFLAADERFEAAAAQASCFVEQKVTSACNGATLCI